MARPRLEPGERRTERLPAARLTAAELAFVQESAAAAGLSLADYVRRLVLGHRVSPRRDSAADKLLLELNRIGVNLNQIARAVNMDRDLDADFQAVLSELAVALAKVTADGS